MGILCAMSTVSTRVTSNQPGVHPRLREVLDRHQQHAWRAPLLIPAWWPALSQWWLAGPPPMLDLGCGTGESVAALADLGHRVLGIDASLDRLQRGRRVLQAESMQDTEPRRAAWVHGDAVTLVRLLHQHALPVARVWLLYPNPWPKAVHLQRRWHGHPVWATLLGLGAPLELRCNWALYAEEFEFALRHAGWSSQREQFQPQTPLTRFEHKYQHSGHALWRVLGSPR